MLRLNLKSFIPALMIISTVFVPSVFAQENELAILVGRLDPTDRHIISLGTIKTAFDGTVSYQFNYANRIVEGGLASVHWELAITGAPRSDVGGTSLLLPKNYSALFFTPGLKLKLLPGAGLSPYLVGGAGLGRYTQSDTLVSGLPNTGDRTNTTWVFDYGGGIDLNVFSLLALRGEIRDFVTGNPKFSQPFLTNKQHNIFIAVGIVFRW